MPKQKGRTSSPDGGPMPSSRYDEDADEFEFYERFTKQLVLKLADKKARALGAQWLKKLREQRESERSVTALKLLMLSLSRGFLSTPFDRPPPDDLCMFDNDGLSEMEMAHMFLSAGHKSDAEKPPSFPQVTTTMATDFRQYASVQEIPKFGIHCYYATSPDPITSWTLPPGRSILGSPDHANPLAWEKCMAKISACVPEISGKRCSKSR